MRIVSTVAVAAMLVATVGFAGIAMAHAEDCSGQKRVGFHTHEGAAGLPTGSPAFCLYLQATQDAETGDVIEIDGMHVLVHDGHYHVTASEEISVVVSA